MKTPALLVVLLLCCVAWLNAQTTLVTGRLKLGSEPAAYLAVRVLPTNVGTLTDEAGQFSFQLAEGSYELICGGLGMQDLKQTIVVKAGEALDLGEIELREDNSLYLDDVHIEGKLEEGEKRSLQMTKLSPHAVVVVSAEKAAKLPDKNGAEVVGRIPGVVMERDQGEGRYISFRGTPSDWSAARINGDRLPVADEDNNSRALNFDVLPTSLIEYAVVGRAVTPDMEADAIGGTVDFLTRFVPEKNTVQATISGGYNAQAAKPMGNGSVLLGGWSRHKKLGVVAGVSWYGRNWASDHYQVYYGSNLDHNMTRLELRDYNGLRNSVGGNLMLEYKPTAKIRLYGRGLYGLMTDDESNFKTMFNWSTGVGQSIKLQNIHNRMNFSLAGGDLGADLQLSERSKLNLRVATYHNEFGYGNLPFEDKKDPRNGYYVLEFEKNVIFTDFLYLDEFGNVTDEFNAYNKLKVLDIDSPIEGYGDHYDSIQPRYRNIVPYKPTDTMFAFTRAYTETNSTYERDPIVVQADFTTHVNAAIRLKFGGKFRHKEGSRRVGLELWDRNPNYPDPLVYNTYRPETIDENGGFLQEIRTPYLGRMFPGLQEDVIDRFIVDRGDTIRYLPFGVKTPYYSQFVGSSYFYTESVLAGYAMASIEPNRHWVLNGGVRAEYTLPSVTGDSVIEDLLNNTRYLVPVSAGKNYLSLLPMLHAKYVIGKEDQIRLAATRSFRRPNFNEIKPGQPAINYTNFDLIYGNPQLRPSYAWNLDLGYEHFFGLVGMASIAGFYKHVTDHIYTAFESSSADNTGISNQFQIPGGVISKKYQNAPKAYAAGIELSFEKKMSFLPWKLKGLGIGVNYAHTWSAMEISARKAPQPLPRQSPDVLNAAIFFEDSTFSIRLALNYKAPYLTELNLYAVKDPQSGDTVVVHQDGDFDMFAGQSMSLDFALSVRISQHLTLFGEALNLANNPMVIYRGRRERPVKTEYYSIRSLVGLKLNF